MTENRSKPPDNTSGSSIPPDDRALLSSQALKKKWSDHFKSLESGGGGLISDRSVRKLSILTLLHDGDATIQDVFDALGTSYANIARCLQRMRIGGLVAIVNPRRKMTDKAVFHLTERGLERMKYLEKKMESP